MLLRLAVSALAPRCRLASLLAVSGGPAHQRPADAESPALRRRHASAAAADTWAVKSVHLHKKEKVLEVAFDDGIERRFSAELLRCLNPAADNAASPRRGGSLSRAAPAVPAVGQPKVVAGRRFVGIMSLEPLGHYAIRVRFDDLSDGIYPYDFLRELGERRLSWAKAYIRLLRRAGLSRDPPPRRARGAGAGGGGGGRDGGSGGRGG